MKILIDVNHPAHIHYFRNFIQIMQSKGHSVLVVSRNMMIMRKLLEYYKIDYRLRNKRPSNIFFKPFYALNSIIIFYKYAKTNNPDVFLGFASFFTSFVSFILKKKSITFDDTEHNSMNHFLYKQFTNYLFTPNCFKKKILASQEIFDGYMELAYLHPNYFRPDQTIRGELGLDDGDKYIILRFISWDATHDRGNKGLDIAFKKELIRVLSKYAKVFISSEGELLEDLKQHKIKIPPERMHDALAFAYMFIGEGATMASECAMLGTPSVYVNSLEVGYCTELEKKYNLIYNFRNSQGVLEKAIDLLNTSNLKQKFQKRRQKMLTDKIDVTAFMVWFIENYPESVEIMKKNPDYQWKFK